MVSANDAIHQPGMLPLELIPDSKAQYAQIPIPKFPRRLLFSPVSEYDGRRVEWVPEWVAQYMKDRFNRRGHVEFYVATDLVQQKHTLALKDQLRDLLREVMQESWFLQALASGGVPQAPAVPEPVEVSAPAVNTPPIAPASRPYKPGGRLLSRKTKEDELNEVHEQEKQELVEA